MRNPLDVLLRSPAILKIRKKHGFQLMTANCMVCKEAETQKSVRKSSGAQRIGSTMDWECESWSATDREQKRGSAKEQKERDRKEAGAQKRGNAKERERKRVGAQRSGSTKELFQKSILGPRSKMKNLNRKSWRVRASGFVILVIIIGENSIL